jgi:hypothetical protein
MHSAGVKKSMTRRTTPALLKGLIFTEGGCCDDAITHPQSFFLSKPKHQLRATVSHNEGTGDIRRHLP